MPEASSTTTNNGSMIAAVIATIGASLCCIGPLVLLALGIGGTWISSLTAPSPNQNVQHRQGFVFDVHLA